uniref:Uncharacterized protein n=1 Tax=Rhizophora mucronata TaxID=61149 RepID=A0A2P2QEV8_RHIMU
MFHHFESDVLFRNLIGSS